MSHKRTSKHALLEPNAGRWQLCTHGTIKQVPLADDVPGRLYGAAGFKLRPMDLGAAGAHYYVPTDAIGDRAAVGFPGQTLAWRMRDYGCWSVPTLARRAHKLASLLLDGWNVVVACHGGHGRTGTLLAATVMVLSSMDATRTDPVTWIRDNYCACAVESDEQVEALEELARLLSECN